MIKRQQRPRQNTMRNIRHQPNTNQNTAIDDKSEIKLKNRSHYQQLQEKYANMAREALRSGERIEAEVFFQYAEHYLRQLNERIRYETELQQANQQRQIARSEQERQNREALQADRPQQERSNESKGIDRNRQHRNSDRAERSNNASTPDGENDQTPHSATRPLQTEGSEPVDSQSNDHTSHDAHATTRRRGPRTFFRRQRSNDSIPGSEPHISNQETAPAAEVPNDTPKKPVARGRPPKASPLTPDASTNGSTGTDA